MSLPDEGAAPAPVRQPRWRRLRPSDLYIPLGIVLLIVLVLELIPANEYLLLPGQALPVEPMIHVKGSPPLHTRGRLFMVDVSLYKVNHLLEKLYGEFNPDAELYPAQDVAGNLSETQYLQYNAQLMDDSEQGATAAALSAVRGYRPRYSTAGPQILFVVPGTPAAAKLQPGDIITAIDGHRVHVKGQVPQLIRRLRPGQFIRMTIRRHKQLLHFSIRTIPSTNGVPAKHGKVAFVGIEVHDRLVFPVKVAINAGSIGGPSAGLMFTLGIVQRLERHDITRGCAIAGTGTIDYLGNVGAIGGARQKAIAAQHAGAKYFFVPTDRADVTGAMRGRGDMKVIPVATLRQALRYLNQLRPCK
ncbi:MAG: PDZ domain-containing protein [Chloroflexota bacterium]|nr:PDZ domain-containing protein [Chloroflexota bacterium]